MKIEKLQMPMCRCGFRSGYAHAVVDGENQRLYTSRSDKTDYHEHECFVREQFSNGLGKSLPGEKATNEH